MNTCAACKIIKEYDISLTCLDCGNAEPITPTWKLYREVPIHYQSYRDSVHKAQRKKMLGYALSKSDELQLRAKQGPKCAICQKIPKQKTLSLDHCHKTKRLRGFLCTTCNLALGGFKDNPAIIQNALIYLMEFEADGPFTA